MVMASFVVSHVSCSNPTSLSPTIYPTQKRKRKRKKAIITDGPEELQRIWAYMMLVLLLDIMWNSAFLGIGFEVLVMPPKLVSYNKLFGVRVLVKEC